MSADKHRGRERRLALLRLAAGSKQGILLHAEGGMAMRNPDLQRLLLSGHLSLHRVNWMGYPLVPKRFVSRFLREVHGKSLHGRVNRSYATITPRGAAALASGRC